MKRIPPKLDPATIGISFVDILFALAIGQILDPIKSWGQDPKKNSLPLPVAMQLAVVLVLTLTSWVGYHSSSNRPRFRLGFFNLDLLKFTLDVAMVVVYFVAAAVAARPTVSLRTEALLITTAFGLYALWDLAGVLQKQGPDNAYERVWNDAHNNPARPDVIEPWKPTNWWRIFWTFVGLILFGGFLVVTLNVNAFRSPTPTEVVIADSAIIVGLISYRYAKDQCS
jgi:hypothetical protein